MTANKMPEMPDMPRWNVVSETWLDEEVAKYASDYGRACYLAGLEAAKACVPAEFASPDFYDQWEAGHDRCREETLTNLTALEQEAKK